MGSAVMPFFEYLVLQLAVTVVGLNVIKEEEISCSGVLKSWIFGQMLLFAVLQLLAVPMILLRWQFNALFWSFLGACIMMFFLGLWRLKKTRIHFNKPELSPLALLLLMIVILLILWQVCTYFFGIHLDEDDARWLVEANDALEYGDMMTRNVQTGTYFGNYVQIKDVSSPWPMMFAVLSRILFGTRVAIVSHTLYAPIEVLLMYGVYWLIGNELFRKIEAKLTFLLCAIIVILLYGGTGFTQGAVSGRARHLWQELLFHYCCICL